MERWVPEETAQRWQGQMFAHGGEARVAGKRADEELELPPKVAVAAALDLRSQLAQTGGAVVGGVALAGEPGGLGVIARMQQRLPVERAVLGDEQEDQAIDHAQKLAVEIGERYLAGAQSRRAGRCSSGGW